MPTGIRVIVVDDSRLMREFLTHGLNSDPYIQVVASAPGPFEARDLIIRHRPDVLTLDVKMPQMNGIDFLKELMRNHPVPTVMVSSFTEAFADVTLESLEAGAVDFVLKPAAGKESSLERMLVELKTKIKIASTVDVTLKKPFPSGMGNGLFSRDKLDNVHEKLIAIGASTGGTEAIRHVLTGLPANGPGVVIVQHMPENFTASFAKRLNTVCPMHVFEAGNCDLAEPGVALIAPGNRHMEVVRQGGKYRVLLNDQELVSGHRPSVDVLMRSVARSAGKNAVGIMLTGMGSDGAQGMLDMRLAGARTLAQDRQSSVVFGMPKTAYEIGAAQRLVPLSNIAKEIRRMLNQRHHS